MDREIKKAILEAHRAERVRRIAEIHAKIEVRKAEHEQKLNAIHARIEAHKAVRNKTVKPVLKAEPHPELQAMKAEIMADVPTIHFPEDDPKYNSARKYDYL